MKTLQQTCAATILCLTLSASAFAGQISSPGIVSPPPPPPGAEASSTNNVSGQSGDATTLVILAIISLLP